jgi:phosphinothricin acetyltransferase
MSAGACVIRPSLDADLAGILAIHNHAVRNETAIWSETPAHLEDRREWRHARLAKGYPVLVADEGGRVLGFGTFGDFRAYEGYRFTVEHSVYVAADARRRGLGTLLLTRLIEDARAMGKHVMVGGIAADNAASLALHARLGFTETARMPQVGYKFGRWLDLVFLQKMLEGKR